ncbi:MAG TPA: hypothetical protein V6C88_01395 [Chroococcidiopsis sp.]
MGQRAIALFFCGLLLLLSGCSAAVAETAPVPGAKTVLPLFQPFIQPLQLQTQVPLVLPTVIPTDAVVPAPHGERPYIDVPIAANGHFQTSYASILAASSDRYEISLDAVSGCRGADRCSFGVLSGEVVYQNTPSILSRYAFEHAPDFQPKGRSPESMEAVLLTRGLSGYFIPFVCGANCDSSKVIWEQNGYRYSVGICYGAEATVVEMANSAIANEN